MPLWGAPLLNYFALLNCQVGQLAATNVGNAFPDVWVRTMEVRTFFVCIAIV
jgi:hypothetical protein